MPKVKSPFGSASKLSKKEIKDVKGRLKGGLKTRKTARRIRKLMGSGSGGVRRTRSD